MLSTTDAIVLVLQPLSDRAHLLHAYTRASGRINFKVYGLGKRHAAGLYAPLSLLQITGDIPSLQTAGGKLSSVRSSQLLFIPSSTSTDLHKQTVAMFVSEVLYLTLRHPMPDEEMFDYLAEAIKTLDKTEEPQNFHLQFLYGFAAQLGFAMPEQLFLPQTRAERQKQLRQICQYFEEHVETWEEPKSLAILTEVFD